MATTQTGATVLIQELEQGRATLEKHLHDGETVSLAQARFVRELQALKNAVAADIRNGKYGTFEFGDVNLPPEKRMQVVSMLKVLVYPEVRVSEEVARRIPLIPDLDLKARASQQVIDELRHARVLRTTLERWGENPDELYTLPLPEIQAVFDFVSSLETVEEFFTANFLCEGLLLPSHLQVMAESDPDAFGEYIKATLADEARHVALARDVIQRYATTESSQARCRRVAETVTQLFINGFRAKVQMLMAGEGV